MKTILLIWMWCSLVVLGISHISGDPDPIVGWAIASTMIGPPYLFIEYASRKKTHASSTEC